MEIPWLIKNIRGKEYNKKNVALQNSGKGNGNYNNSKSTAVVMVTVWTLCLPPLPVPLIASFPLSMLQIKGWNSWQPDIGVH